MTDHSADRLFLDEVARRGLSCELSDDGYVFRNDGWEVVANLENLRLEYARDQDPRAIERFVDAIVARGDDPVPGWSDARHVLRYTLEAAADPEDAFGDALHDEVIPGLYRVFVFVTADESRLTWVETRFLETWGVTRDDVVRCAEANIAELIADAELELRPVRGQVLGMLATPSVSFKASMLVSPALRTLVEPHLGWPVLAVAPARDFVYVFRETADELIPYLGQVVVREWENSGYPVLPAVLRLGDDGIALMGRWDAASA